jgi:NAD(P)-dependent dehydrogenase (short-subunit alcohol dehydrogenase family)
LYQPGWIDVSRDKKKSDKKPVGLTAEDHSQHPAGRVGKPSNIANMVLFLPDPENDFITEQYFIIDGEMIKK